MPTSVDHQAPRAGDLLRWWRTRRGLSQMALAHRVGISPRHMSFVETGRSRPGREVLIRLAEALGLPFRETNVLLESAGYARVYRETPLGEGELARLREILEIVLDRYEPYGAVVVDAGWTLLMANRAHVRLTRHILGERPETDGEGRVNLLVELFRPGGFRERLRNWPEVCHHLLERLRRQVAENPTRAGFQALLEKLESYDLPPPSDVPPSPLPVLPMHFDLGGAELRLVSLVTTFGAPQDVTAQELRLEAFLPADGETDRALRALADREGPSP